MALVMTRMEALAPRRLLNLYRFNEKEEYNGVERCSVGPHE
jgi:hypothetical protein